MKKLSKAYLRDELQKRLIEQDASIDAFLPYLITYAADLHTVTRPVGAFFLLGPTGTGKTRTVEALAEVLHGDASKLIRVDCGQFSQSHEVAKLTGSPPGYLGHRETPPFFSISKFEAARSVDCELTVILFDEIEKGHQNLFQSLLSMLDKGELSLGDNSIANFRKSLIFFTSNLGAKEMSEAINTKFGFLAGMGGLTDTKLSAKLESIGSNAAKKKFAPEFFNRIDEVITYKPLSTNAIRKILKIQLDKVRDRLLEKNKTKQMFLLVTDEVEDFLIKKGFSEIYGARELNRTVQRELVQPLAELVMDAQVTESLVIRTKLADAHVTFELLPYSKFEIGLGKEGDEQ